MGQQRAFAPRGMKVVVGQLRTRGTAPLTRFCRDGWSRTDDSQARAYGACVETTRDVLEFSRPVATICRRRDSNTASPDSNHAKTREFVSLVPLMEYATGSQEHSTLLRGSTL